jgi:hypothetical protein
MRENDVTDESSLETVCSLPEEKRRKRIAALRRDLWPLVKRKAPLPDAAGVLLEFDATPALREQLEELVAFERQCCGGLEWRLEAPPRDEALRLTIEGLPPDARFFETLGIEGGSREPAEPADDAPSPVRPAGPGRGLSRFAKAGGLGVGAAFFLFCVVPIGLAAAGGATLAAWLGPLDHPAVVVLGGAALAIPVWRQLRRREAACSGQGSAAVDSTARG